MHDTVNPQSPAHSATVDAGHAVEQLRKVIESQTFKPCPRLCSLLQFLVTESLRGSPLGESAVGVRSFGKPAKWDSKNASVVRTTVRRLRQRLDRYYEREGQSDLYLIRIPVGGYLPQVSARQLKDLSQCLPSEDAFASDVLTSATAIFGRDSELAKLQAKFAKARGGQGCLFCVGSEAGVGKTALVECFLRELGSESDVVVGIGRCYPELEDSEAYAPWRDVISDLLCAQSSISDVFQRTAPGWRAFRATQYAEAASFRNTSPRREMFQFISALAERATVVLFLDDLHWADAASIDLLDYLCFRMRGMRVLVVATYRPSDMQLRQTSFLKLEPELRMRGICESLTLQELSPPVLARVLNDRFWPNHFSSEVMSWFWSRTNGNALCVHALAGYAVRQGWVGRRHGIWIENGNPAEWPKDLPESLLGWVSQKIHLLEGEELAVAHVASIHGAEFNALVLGRVLNIDPQAVERQMAHLTRAHGLLLCLGDQPIPNPRVVRCYRFAHPLYQEALLQTLGPIERSRWSLALAEALQELYGHSDAIAAVSARLFETAGMYERALACYRQAAFCAVRVSAYRQAHQLAHAAETLVDRLERDEAMDRTQIECLTLQALSASTLGGFGAAAIEGIYHRALQVARRLGDDAHCFAVANVHWGFVSNASFSEARRIAQQLQQQAERTGQAVPQALASLASGVSALHLGEPVVAERFLANAERLWQNTDDERAQFQLFSVDPFVATLLMLARVFCLRGEWTEGRRYAEDAIRTAETLGHERTIAYALALGADVYHLCRDVGAALRLSEDAERRAECCGLPYERTWACAIRAWALGQSGDHQSATRLFEESLTNYRGPASTKLLCNYAEALWRAGRQREATQMLGEAFKSAESLGERYYEAALLRMRVEFRLTRKARKTMYVNACTRLQQAVDLAYRQGSKTLELRAMMSLCRISAGHDRTIHLAVVTRLKELYRALNKGDDYTDLREAKELLGSD